MRRYRVLEDAALADCGLELSAESVDLLLYDWLSEIGARLRRPRVRPAGAHHGADVLG